MDTPYAIVREKYGRSYYQVLKAPDGTDVKHFGDSQLREAETLRDLLNAAYAEGVKSRNAAYADLRAENDRLSSKVIGLQFQLGRAEVALRTIHNAGHPDAATHHQWYSQGPVSEARFGELCVTAAGRALGML